jgi:squalene-hopene/tetraprenyl-beta-curcumene cyclase
MRMKLLLVFGLTLALAAQSGPSPDLSAATRTSLQQSLEKGLAYLRAQQKPNGSWEMHEGITGLALLSFYKNPARSSRDDAMLDKGLKFIASLAKPDGSIFSRDMPNANTSLAIMSMEASRKPEYRPYIQKGQAFLVKLQFDEEEGVRPNDPKYGGIGYDDETRADLSNLHHVLEALKQTALSESNPVWNKAITFIQRTQNRRESNDQSWAASDGGFVYMPGMSFAGGTKSYGSMTYAGLLSYSYANLKKGDPRVEAAYKWIRDNYTVDENPGLGKTTLYYYYMVFAKGLKAYGEPIIMDAKGVRHNWREDLGKKLISLQHSEGYWVNSDDPSHWQDNKVLVTAFTAIAIDNILSR